MKIYLDNCCYNRPFDDQSRAFDYTKWRRDNLYENMSLSELNKKAAEFAKDCYNG